MITSGTWPLWLAVAISSVVVVALLWRLWRWAPWRGPRTRYPIVLAHGLMGFDTLGVGSLRQEYFKGIATHLEGLGNTVFKPIVPPAGSVRQRAETIAEAVRRIPARRVNIIAHSMGGLDARYAIAKLGLGDKVASLTTIGTPHRGTRAADAGTLGMGRFLGPILGKVGLAAIGDLTSEAMDAFNQEVSNARGVFYGCVLATVPDSNGKLHPLLRPTFALLGRAGPSDGLVTEASQRWGRVLMRVEADHWGQIGWSKHTDAVALYERVARALRARGF